MMVSIRSTSKRKGGIRRWPIRWEIQKGKARKWYPGEEKTNKGRARTMNGIQQQLKDSEG
jgi:hypothetical protein